MSSVITSDTKVMKRVESILISQPQPENGKSPYFDLAKKYKIKVDFRQFIQVEGIDGKDVRRSKVNLSSFQAIIFTSRSSIDHFFRVCEELRITMSQDTRYICKSEAIALYLQKYILYRKRKVSYGPGREDGLMKLLLKHKGAGKFCYPCSDVAKDDMPFFLEEKGFDFEQVPLYRTVNSDLSDLENIFYDIIVFFSPTGLRSLYHNFPDYEQKDTRIAAFGSATAQAVKDAGLTLNIEAPVKDSPSMSMAIEKYMLMANRK